jgi:predicted dehydrogenase
MKLRAAVVGCGRIGSEYSDDTRVRGVYSHAGAYAASPHAELVAVCDADATRAADCAKRWGLAAGYHSLDAMLRAERPDIVSICTPDATHAAVLRETLAFASVRGVLAEKPLALDAQDAAAVVQLAQQREVKLAVNYLRRYAAGHQRARDFIAAGGIGRIQNISGLYSGGLVHNGSHWIDHARWLAGEIESLEGFAVASDPASPDVRISFANGARAMLHACDAREYAVFETDVVGTLGRVRFTELGHRIEYFAAGDSPYYSGYRNLLAQRQEEGGLDTAMANAVEDLLACVRDGGSPRCSGQDGLMALTWALRGESGRATRG